jgi:hypothetical protein
MMFTSSLDPNEFFLHFHEIGKGEGKNNDDGSFVKFYLPVEVTQRHLREKASIWVIASRTLRKMKAKKDSLRLPVEDLREETVEFAKGFFMEDCMIELTFNYRHN